jgi:hypothetical protein
MNITAVKRRRPELLRQAIEEFGGWKAALEAAGVDYASIQIALEDTCICAVCGAKGAILTAHLLAKHRMKPQDYVKQYPDADVMAEKLRAARLRAPGAFPHWEPVWSREYLIDRLKEYHRRNYPLNYTSMARTERGLAATALLLFGSWDELLRQAGFPPESARVLAPAKSLTRWDVLEELRNRHRRRLPLNDAAMLESTETLRIMNAARRRFGSYPKALREAGIKPSEVQLKTRCYTLRDRQMVIEEAQRIAALKGRAWHEAVVVLHQEFNPIAYRCFGSWGKVAKAADVPPFRLLLNKVPNAETVYDSLEERMHARLDMSPGVLFKEDRSLYQGVLKQFGTFDGLEAAIEEELRKGGAHTVRLRFILDHIRKWRPRRLPKPKVPPKDPRRFDSPEALLNAIRTRQSQGLGMRPTDLKRPAAEAGDFTLLVRSRKHFGTWKDALTSAGLKPAEEMVPKPKHDFPDVASVVGAIQRRHERSQSLRYHDMRSLTAGDLDLLRAAQKHCGGWRQAVIRAGLKQALDSKVKLRKYPNPEAVLRELDLRRSQGLSLAAGKVCRKDLTLYNSARKFFGSWQAALSAKSPAALVPLRTPTRP